MFDVEYSMRGAHRAAPARISIRASHGELTEVTMTNWKFEASEAPKASEFKLAHYGMSAQIPTRLPAVKDTIGQE